MSAIKSWSLNTYTNSTWTDLVAGTSYGETVRGLSVANTSGSAITLQVRVATSGGVSQAVVFPSTSISPGVAFHINNVDPLNLTNGQRVQIFASAAGLEFYASGISYTPSS